MGTATAAAPGAVRGVLRRVLRLLAVCAATLLGLLAVGWLLVRQPVLGSLAPGPAARADAARLRHHVEVLSEELSPRDVDHPENLARVADYVAADLRGSGGRVERQPYTIRGARFENVVARLGPRRGAPLVVGAHYDSFGDFGPNPGADDNASGVAALLELARLLGGAEVPVPVELVGWSTEEPPFFGSQEMGSARHAARLADERRPPRGVICLEMVGFFSPRQPAPALLFRLLYPRRGDFLVAAGRWQDRAAIRHLQRAFRGADAVPLHGFVGPSEMLDASDHRSYWARGWPAVLVTDTAFVRNPNYHTAHDRASTLDYARMARAVDGVANAVLHGAELPLPEDG